MQLSRKRIVELSCTMYHLHLLVTSKKLSNIKNDKNFAQDVKTLNVNNVNNSDKSNRHILKIVTFNCKNIQTCGPFFQESIKYIDICLIQEHWLFNCQLSLLHELHENLTGVGKSVDDKDPLTPNHLPRGYGGVAILWNKKIDNLINVIQVGNERIQCVELKGVQNKLLLISVYMPCKSSPNSLTEFQECVDILYEIVQIFSPSHKIIIGGDFNENLLQKSNSLRNRYILDFMKDSDMTTVDVGKTFIHSRGIDCSSIDFILFSEKYKENILSIRRLECASSVSDHYPVIADIRFSLSDLQECYENTKNNSEITSNSHRFDWNKVDGEKYKETLNEQLEAVDLQLNDNAQIDTAIMKVNSAITTAIATIAPPRKVRRKKPKLKLMSTEILDAIKAKKSAYLQWKNNGKPQEPTNLYTLNKKFTTYELRKTCRKEVAQRRIKERETLIEARTMDKKLFYSLVNQQRGKLNRFIDELNVGDAIYDGANILEGWKLHFGDLAKESDPSKFDQQYFKMVDFEYQQIINICRGEYTHETVSLHELELAIQKLNRNKSVDAYGISAECLLYGGNTLNETLLNIINASFRYCYLSASLKVGILTPIFKNKGEITNSKNYRGITITPTISKLIETILKLRVNPRIMETQNPLQRGFTENTAPLISSLMLEEFERENKDLKKPTIFGMLDAKSAFDVVRHNNLIRKLFHMGLSAQNILMIDQLYKDATSKVKWKNQSSETFPIEQGVRQGGTLSADLYKVYVNQLLNLLTDSNMGGRIGAINCCAPTCADDIALVGNNPLEIQSLVNIAYDYSRREGYLLQPEKSVILPVKNK